MSYKLKLDIFEGPLDLLLYLIKKNDLDIYNIPIAQVTAQYMEYIAMMKLLDLDIIGDFLVMAATLMQIKSKMLLPPDPNSLEQDELDPRDALVRRLEEYKRFKEIAETLQNKEAARQDLFIRQMDAQKLGEMKDEACEVYFEATLFDLINAFSTALKRTPEEVIHEIIKEEFTVDQMIHDIVHLLIEKPMILLTDLFSRSRSKLEIIVTFLAILELIRLKEILAVQRELHGEIEVMRNKQNSTAVSESASKN